MVIEYEIIIKLLISMFLGSLIGLERRSKELGVGMRTSSLIALTSCLFTVITTAVIVWILTAIGFTIAAGYYIIALVSTILVLMTLFIKRIGIE